MRISWISFLPFDRKSEKGFAKPFSWTAVFFWLIMRARARPLFSALKIRFRILRSIANPKSGFQNLNPDFPIKGTRTKKLEPIQTNPDILSPFHFLYPDLFGRRLTLLWRAVWKRCGFGKRIHWFRVNRRPIQVKKTPGFQKYPGPVNVALAFLAPGSGPWRLISANPGLKFCSVFVFYLPMCCLE